MNKEDIKLGREFIEKSKVNTGYGEGLTADMHLLEQALDYIEDPWVRVKDNLPDMGQPVLTCGSHEYPITAYRTNNPDGAKWIDYSTEEWIVGVTHWMIPNPPK